MIVVKKGNSSIGPIVIIGSQLEVVPPEFPVELSPVLSVVSAGFVSAGFVSAGFVSAGFVSAGFVSAGLSLIGRSSIILLALAGSENIMCLFCWYQTSSSRVIVPSANLRFKENHLSTIPELCNGKLVNA